MDIRNRRRSALGVVAANDASPATSGVIRMPRGPDLWACVGAKGGVGTSVVAASLAVAAAARGRRCLLIDANLGAGSQHVLLGQPIPSRSIDDFFADETVALADIVLPTEHAGLAMVCARTDRATATEPTQAQLRRLLRDVLRSDFDVVVLDLGTGASSRALDLFLSSRVQILVTTAEPPALQGAFGFLKRVTARSAGRSGEASCDPRVVVNMAEPDDARRAFDVVEGACERFVARRPARLATLLWERVVAGSVTRGLPVVAHAPQSDFALAVTEIASDLCEERRRASDVTTARAAGA